MADNKAHVSSVDAIENFREHLAIFNENTTSLLDKVQCELTRLNQLIEIELPARARMLLHKWEERQKMARFELSSGRTAAGRLAAEQQLRIATGKVRELNDKILIMKKWQKELPAVLPAQVNTLVKFKTFMINDAQRATALLKRFTIILDEYNEGGQ
jgi:hypothetical protein